MGVVGNGMSIMKTGVLAGNIPPPPIIPTAYVSDGLVLYVDAGVQASYPGSGSRWTDTIGKKQFTLYGSSTPRYAATNGGFLQFSGSLGQYAQTSTALPSLTTWSAESWVYWQNNSDLSSLVTDMFGTRNGCINYLLGCPGLGGGNYTTTGYLPPEGGAWTARYSLTPNRWYQVLGTYDGTNIKLYINGTLQNTLASSAVPVSGNTGIRLMCRWDFIETFNGGLGLTRIYNIALDQSQVQQNYTANLQR